MDVLAAVGEVRAVAGVDPAAIDEQCLVAVVERRPLDRLLRKVELGDELGAFRTRKAAQEAWAEVVKESNWSPPEREVNREEALSRERKERWARNRAG